MLRQTQELLQQLAPSTENKLSELVAMKVDAIRECKGNEEKEDGQGSTTNKPESLAMREPDHEVVRMKEDPDTQD